MSREAWLPGATVAGQQIEVDGHNSLACGGNIFGGFDVSKVTHSSQGVKQGDR
ncbi:MAG: hypothetical protein OEZ39_00380 [Gammaproteobacteria bacterium]|nr:hypothetical protein [Gammaproteobacteria bacterium]MDH5650304.1 hypothetical protein [Gammaproteobacteria bacterium]